MLDTRRYPHDYTDDAPCELFVFWKPLQVVEIVEWSDGPYDGLRYFFFHQSYILRITFYEIIPSGFQFFLNIYQFCFSYWSILFVIFIETN